MTVGAATQLATLAPILVVEDNPMDLDLTLRAFSLAEISGCMRL